MIISQQPYHPELRKYIDYYYFQQSDLSTDTRYTYFPNIRTTISVYKNSIGQFREGVTHISPTATPRLTKLLTPPLYRPATVVQKGKIEKVAIVFFAHGINYFINVPVGKISPQPLNAFDAFDPSFDPLLNCVFETDSIPEKTFLLDQYLYAMLQTNVHPMFERARKLVEHDSPYPIGRIAEELRFNRKSLFKWFKLFTVCSPEQYRSICIFRSSINQKFTRPELRLTEIAHAYYADQSHFIKNIKKLTGMTPQHFFDEVKQIGDQSTFWALK